MCVLQLRSVHTVRLSTVAFALALALSIATRANASTRIDPATAQVAHCQPSWIPTFGGHPGVSGTIRASAVFDDGSGPALYVGGTFTNPGGAIALDIAKWDGSRWSSLYGMFNPVYALTVFDDGSGPALFAGTAIGVSKWNGASWTHFANGPSGTVYALASYDDGHGPALYAGGSFSAANGFSTGGLAKWDGSAWSLLGSGQQAVGVAGPSGTRVTSLAVFDDGGGDALYVGGSFTHAGTYPAACIARWNGVYWSSLASGVDNRVSALAVFDDGTGPALFAGGLFSNAGGVATDRIAKWNGSAWSFVVSGTNGEVLTLASIDMGQGQALYVGGEFTILPGIIANRVAKWNGSNWTALGSGVGTTGDAVRTLALFTDAHGRTLYAGGSFVTASGSTMNSIARWNGSTWSATETGFETALNTLTVFDDGTGPALFAGGWFTSVHGVAANYIAKWNGASWSALGTGMDGRVFATAVFDDGTGPALYVGGEFSTAGGGAGSRIAKWNGSSWSALGSGLTIPGSGAAGVAALAVFDDGSGPALYAGGYFTTAGGVTVNHIAKWDGLVWSALGTGMGATDTVNALAVFDDGSGPALYAAGRISSAGGVAAMNIAKWNGTSWSGLGSTMTAVHYVPVVSSLTVFDDGAGPALYVGGLFTSVAGVAVNHIAKWNGSSWSALAGGFENFYDGYGAANIKALTEFDEGNGPRLFAMGSFTTAGGVAASGIAKWNGSTWSPLGHGLSVSYYAYGGALATYDDSSGPALYVGGNFYSTPDSHDSYLAKWGCPFVSSGATYCTPGTTSGGCVPTISASGSASATNASGFTLSINNLESHRMGVIFYGIHGQHASPWGAGGTSLLCVKSPTQRLHPYDSGGSPGSCNGLISEDWNLFISTHASALGQPFLGGETVWAQGWFRDPPSAKTTALSNGLVFAVAP